MGAPKAPSPARPLLGLAAVVLVIASQGPGCASGSPGKNKNSNNNTGLTDGGVGTLGLGLYCSRSSECSSALCLGVGLQFLCSQPCATNPCPSGFYCAKVDVQSAPAGEPVPASGFYCLPDRGGLCKPCGSDINCAFEGDRCLDLGGGVKVCGRDCSFDGSCPVGFECRQNQCWPSGNTCDCTPERVGAARFCQKMNEYGVCPGSQTCAASGWETCDARIPSFEVCNGIDDDCDGHLPAEELDTNGSGVIDCLESCVATGAEVCDGVDNDCNGQVDEGDPVELCGQVANGAPVCAHGECAVGSCEPGWVDVDGDFDNGCECQLTVSGGPTCEEPEVVGPLSDAGSGQIEVRTGILQGGQERWYAVQAVDSPDTGVSACDQFHFRVIITQNPGGVYKFDVLSDHCEGDAACAEPVTDFRWYTNFRDGTGEGAVGECPCSNTPIEGVNECTDDSRLYFIRLFRAPGSALTCEPYEIEFSNGVYDAPL